MIQEKVFALIFTGLVPLPMLGVWPIRIRATLRKIALFYAKNIADRRKRP